MTVFGVYVPICVDYFNAAILTMIWGSVFYILVHVFLLHVYKIDYYFNFVAKLFFDAVDFML